MLINDEHVHVFLVSFFTGANNFYKDKIKEISHSETFNMSTG